MLETAIFEGELKGERNAFSKANRNFTINLIKNTDFSDEKIASLVGVEANWVAEIRKGVQK